MSTNDTNITLKYGSLSAVIYHVKYIFDEDLDFLNSELSEDISEKILEVFFKFMRDNDLEKYLDKRRP